MSFLLLEMVAEETGLVRDVEFGVQSQTGAESLLVERENLVAREVEDGGDVIQVHSLALLPRPARLHCLTVQHAPALQSSLPLDLLLVPLQPLRLVALGLSQIVDAVLAISLELFDSVFDFFLFADACHQFLILVNTLNVRYKFELVQNFLSGIFFLGFRNGHFPRHGVVRILFKKVLHQRQFIGHLLPPLSFLQFLLIHFNMGQLQVGLQLERRC